MKISKIKARQILDSRGNPTIEVDVFLKDGSFGRAAVPSGASTGTYEAHELRDEDESKYLGKGVLKAVKNAESLLEKLSNTEFNTQAELDNKLIEIDGTENKSNLGANAILGVSLAFSKAIAKSKNLKYYEYIHEIYGLDEISMPTPMFNVINGGKHADWSTDFQEFMIIVKNRPYSEQLRAASEVFHHIEKILKARGLNINIGNEGGFAPGFSNNKDALDTITEAINNAGYKLGEDIVFALDIASSEFFENDKYVLKTENRELSKEEYYNFIADLINNYPIQSLEDPFSEDDWELWSKLTEEFGDKLQIVGDDLLVTNPKRIQTAIQKKACNSLLVKVNQIGTLTEALNAMKMAKEAGWSNVISHRSGETEDVSISDIAVGTGAGQIKTGAPSRGERTAKFNELLRIGENIN